MTISVTVFSTRDSLLRNPDVSRAHLTPGFDPCLPGEQIQLLLAEVHERPDLEELSPRDDLTPEGLQGDPEDLPAEEPEFDGAFVRLTSN